MSLSPYHVPTGVEYQLMMQKFFYQLTQEYTNQTGITFDHVNKATAMIMLIDAKLLLDETAGRWSLDVAQFENIWVEVAQLEKEDQDRQLKIFPVLDQTNFETCQKIIPLYL